MIFGFSLCVVPLLVTQVIYFRLELKNLRVENYQKVVRCVVANTRREMLVSLFSK